MNIANKLRFTASTIALLGGFGLSTVAGAQDMRPSSTSGTASADVTDGQSMGLGDIVVTAQRRSESLQKTSVAVDVISSEELTRAGVTQPQGLSNVLPGVQIAAVGPQVQIYIRGIGSIGTISANPAIAFNIDGVYVGNSASIASEFYDVDRVEVVKGPQGTLYGRNASGGAVNLLTRRPKLGALRMDYSAEFISYDNSVTENAHGATVEGAINLPLGQTLAARVSGIFVSKDGFTSQGYSDDKHESARVKLLWEPSSDTSLLLNGSLGHIGGKGGGVAVLVNKVPGLVDQSPWLDATDPLARNFLIASVFPPLVRLATAIDPPRPEEGYQDLNFRNVSAELNTNLGFATLTVLPAYRRASYRYTALTLLRLDIGRGYGTVPPAPNTSDQYSVEARLANESDQLRWVIGGFYYDEKQITQYINGDVLSRLNARESNNRTRSYAAFGQATYSISDPFRVIAGLRYTMDRRSIDGRNLALAPSSECQGVLGYVCLTETIRGSSKESNVSWKGGLEFDVTPDTLFYATASSGFKAGGFNPQISPLAPPTSTQPYEFKPEKLISYELGLKSRFFDNRLQLNLEAFYWDYKDLQQQRITVSGAGNTGFSIDNAGNARMYGASIDLLARPWRGGTLSGALEYLNAKYDSYLVDVPNRFILPGSYGCPLRPSARPPGAAGPITTIDCSGFQIIRAPTWTGSAGYTHSFGLAAGGTIEAQGNVRFASSRWLTADFVPAVRAPSYQTFDASLSYTPATDNFSVTGFVRNITNEAVYQGGFQAPFQPGIVAGNIAPPRTYGVRFEVKFN